MAATAKKNGMRFVAVVMGEETSKIRNKEVSEMFDYAFAQYKIINLLKDKNIIGQYRVENGKDEYVDIIPNESALILRKKSEKIGVIDYDIKMNKLKAPLKKGNIVGKLYIKENNKIIKEVSLTVKEHVLKTNFFNLFLKNIKDMITGDVKLN